MAKNEILPFAAGDSANVLTQEEYENLVARLMGFNTGIAKAAELNKVWRQTAFVAHCIAQFVCNQTGKDVLDNGKTDDFLGLLDSTLGNSIQFCPTIPTEKKSEIIYVPANGLMYWDGSKYIPDSKTWFDSAPVGVTFDWEGVSPPSEKWLKYDGSTFDPARYPKLAALGRYTNNKLPDVSDKYIRYIGNRTDKWLQYHTMEDTMQRIEGEWNAVHGAYVAGNNYLRVSGAIKYIGGIGDVGNAYAGGSGNRLGIDTALVARTSDETRPKTIMIRTKIVKAA